MLFSGDSSYHTWQEVPTSMARTCLEARSPSERKGAAEEFCFLDEDFGT